jgi:AcrR family transcriptional regulator/DNA-binding MarR family transcriptional regulator
MPAGRSGGRVSKATRRGRQWRAGTSPRAPARASQATEFRRARLLTAAASVVFERGYGGMTATAVIERAGVSRKTFYDLFESSEQCYAVLVEEALARLAAVLALALEQPLAWQERIRGALTELLAFMEREPQAGLLALSHIVGYGPSGLKLSGRARVLELMRGAVDAGRLEAGARRGLPSLAPEALVGGVLAVIHTHAQARSRDLMALANPLTWMIVLPYLGPAAASRQLARQSPEAVAALPAPKPVRDALRGLKIRVTFRTVQTLEVIAVAPGASNTEIGARVGIADQGQISKLLARLSRIGLIENTGAGQSRGAANAWRLTPRGKDLELAVRLRPQTESRREVNR